MVIAYLIFIRMDYYDFSSPFSFSDNTLISRYKYYYSYSAFLKVHDMIFK